MKAAVCFCIFFVLLAPAPAITNEAITPMIAMTTSNSTKVKAVGTR